MKKLFAVFSLLFVVTFLLQSTTVLAGGMADAKKVVDYAKKNPWKPQPGFKGGQKFENREGRLPLKDDKISAPDKAKLTYKEFDVNPLVKGQNRDAERVIIALKSGAFYKAYCTSDHYGSFSEIK